MIDPARPLRWKIACVNWGHPDAPHALAYLWDGETLHGEHYAATLADAIAHVDGHVITQLMRTGRLAVA